MSFAHRYVRGQDGHDSKNILVRAMLIGRPESLLRSPHLPSSLHARRVQAGTFSFPAVPRASPGFLKNLPSRNILPGRYTYTPPPLDLAAS